jgi:hypothetical protein
MIPMLEDIRLALRNICRQIGLDETASAIVPLLVLGLALNFLALSATEFLRESGKMRRNHLVTHNAVRTDLNVARTELKAVRTVVISTIKKFNNSCTHEWVMNQRKKLSGYRMEVGLVWSAPSSSQQAVPTSTDGCDVKLIGNANANPNSTKMIAFVQC